MEQEIDRMLLDEKKERDEMQTQIIPPFTLKRKCQFDAYDSGEDVFEVVTRIKRIKFPVYIVFKTLNGRCFSLDLDSNDTVETLKEILASMEGIPAQQQKLIFNGQQMREGNKSIHSYGVSDGSVIYIVLALPHRRGFSGISAQHRVDTT